MKVLASPSLPCTGISLPFKRKLMPAAFLVFTTTSRVACTEVCAGAMRVSSATGLPSAVIETHVVFSARISRVKMAGGFAACVGGILGAGLAAAAGEFADSLFGELLAGAEGRLGAGSAVTLPVDFVVVEIASAG